MKPIKTGYAIFCLILLALSGCAHYQIRGTLDGKTPVAGTITSYLFESKGDIYIHTLDGKMYCSGIMRITHTPNLSLSCDEEEGSVTLDCSNGRAAVTNWASVGCNQGYGHGYTDHGATLNYVFFPYTQSMMCPNMN